MSNYQILTKLLLSSLINRDKTLLKSTTGAISIFKCQIKNINKIKPKDKTLLESTLYGCNIHIKMSDKNVKKLKHDTY